MILVKNTMCSKNKLLMFFLLIFCTQAFAFDYPTTNRFIVGVNTYHRDYKEAFCYPSKSNEAGQLYGLVLGFETKSVNALMFSAEYNIDRGITRYDGSLQSISPNSWGAYMGPHQDTTKNAFLTLDLALGYSFPLKDYHQLTPLIGFNSHRWDRGLNGMDEYYKINSAVLGFQYDYVKHPTIALGFVFKLLSAFDSNIKIENSFYKTIEMELGKKRSVEIAFPITFKSQPTCRGLWRITPYYRLQRIGISELVIIPSLGGVYEPSSRNHVVGIKLLHLFSS